MHSVAAALNSSPVNKKRKLHYIYISDRTMKKKEKEKEERKKISIAPYTAAQRRIHHQAYSLHRVAAPAHPTPLVSQSYSPAGGESQRLGP